MLAILSTHPIQYQVPLWQMLARDGTVPFEVWYLTDHAARQSRDEQFGTNFAWDLDMLKGYPHRFLKTPDGANPNTFWRARVSESLPMLFEKSGASVLWVQGWQVAAYWQAVWAAKNAGLQVWLRGESNNLAPVPVWKRAIKRQLLGRLFDRVDHFLCIGSANRDLYRSFGVPEEKLHMAPYAVDNERFRKQADAARGRRSEIRRQVGIPEDAFCVLFCGKFIPKKRPMDLIGAVRLANSQPSTLNPHLLFVGSGALGDQMRAKCNVVFDAENPMPTSGIRPLTSGTKPTASFAGFLNQTEISQAYVAADVLVLPSDYGETWGLVVNEAMASGLPCVISDHCGCAADLGRVGRNAVYECGDVETLVRKLGEVSAVRNVPAEAPHGIEQTVSVVGRLYASSSS